MEEGVKMTIEEAKQAKNQCEGQIMKIIGEYQRATGLTVEDVRLDRQQAADVPVVTLDVRL